MYQGFNIDITALDAMQQQLSRAERLATLGQVAAGIAHEIRNPLVGIGSTAALLRDEFDPSDEKRADLDIILNETRTARPHRESDHRLCTSAGSRADHVAGGRDRR